MSSPLSYRVERDALRLVVATGDARDE
jgi:hypothetical protein